MMPFGGNLLLIVFGNFSTIVFECYTIKTINVLGLRSSF
jgi:hypothetical protein